jgi:uncharacterized membrane protein
MNFQVVRFLHLLGAVMLLGNLMVTGFWAWYFYAGRDAVVFRHAVRAILWADLIFTVVGASVLGVTGFMLLEARELTFATGWVKKGGAALGIAMTLWLFVMVPLQNRMTRTFADDRRALKRVFTRWMLTLWTVTAVLLYGLVVMVHH